MRGRGINATTSRRTRDNRGGGKSNGNDNVDGKCCVPPSRDLAMTALVLTAETMVPLIADNANGGNGNVAIVKSIFLRRGVG